VVISRSTTGEDLEGVRPRRRGPLRRFAGATLTSLVGLFVVGLVALVTANLVGYRSLIVRSGSMGAAIPVGSLVLTEPVPRESIQVGDVTVVAPTGPDSARLHRVIEVRGEGDEVIVVTQGDANAFPDSDPTTLSPQVQVRATSVPMVGYVLGAAGSRVGLLALSTVAAAMIGWWGLRVLWRPATGPAAGVAAGPS
jgi:signal peptidase